MAIEIERRFLVKNDEWKKFITKQIIIEQGYLSNSLKDWIIRLRCNGEEFKIAIKKNIKNFTNFEFEYLIPTKDGKKIMSTLTNTIKKERFFLEIEKKVWIIDCFKEKNYPLKIAEIELSEEEEAIKIPSFVSKEITGQMQFSNIYLSTYPLSIWENDDLASLFKN